MAGSSKCLARTCRRGLGRRQTVEKVGQLVHDFAWEAPDQGLDEAAELYAGNRAAIEWMGVQAFAKDLGRVVPIRMHTDSSAALSIISRIGLGKARHIEIQ